MKTLAAPLDLILRNLIGNAIRHHDRDVGWVEVSARCDGFPDGAQAVGSLRMAVRPLVRQVAGVFDDPDVGCAFRADLNSVSDKTRTRIPISPEHGFRGTRTNSVIR